MTRKPIWVAGRHTFSCFMFSFKWIKDLIPLDTLYYHEVYYTTDKLKVSYPTRIRLCGCALVSRVCREGLWGVM